jgi:hypothetical protein
MGEAVRKLEEAALRRFEQEAAFVEGVDGEALELRVRGGTCRAVRAASCLVAPGVGDKVLVAHSEDGQEAYVLAVLTRRDAAAATELVVDGDVALRSRRGTVEVAAPEGLRMMTGGKLELASSTLRMRAEDAKLFVKSMAYVGREVVGRISATKVAGGVLDSAWETITQQATRVYRNVREGEFVRAGSVDVRCDNAVTLQGENASMTAKKLIKMDAGQILMG